MAFTASLWGQQATHTINIGQVPSSQSNVPLLITKDLALFPSSMLDGGSTSALNGGGDIRVSTDTAGANQLPVEIVSCVVSATPANQELVMWVRVPTAADGEVIYITWNRAGESQPPVTDPFGRNAVWQDYAAVIHANETGTNGVFIDSTGNGHDTTLTTGSTLPTTSTANPFGLNWPDFSGNEGITLASSSALVSNTDFTISCWLNADVSSFVNGVFGNRGGGTNWAQMQSSMRWFSARNTIENFVDNGNRSTLTSILTVIAQDSVSMDCYDNGILQGQDTSVTHPIDTAQLSNFRAGTYFDGSPARSYNGRTAEFRIKQSKDSANRVLTEYNNQSNQGAWATIGTPYNPGGTSIDITPNSVDTNWASNNYSVSLTGEISVTPSSVNTSYTANSYSIALTGEVSITPNSVNTNYFANNYSVLLSTGINITPESVTTNYTANNYTVTLQGTIEITPESVNTNWLTNNYIINLSQVIYNGKRVKRVNAKRKHVKISAINKVKRFN